MSLKDEILAHRSPGVKPPTVRCVVGQLEDQLGAEFTEVLEDRSIAASNIMRWLKDQDRYMSSSAIVCHRNGSCSCR